MLAMGPNIALITKVIAPEPTTFRFRIAVPVQDFVCGTVIEVAVLRWLNENALDLLRGIAAVQLPGRVAFVSVLCRLISFEVVITVSVLWSPDFAVNFAVTYGRAQGFLSSIAHVVGIIDCVIVVKLKLLLVDVGMEREGDMEGRVRSVNRGRSGYC